MSRLPAGTDIILLQADGDTPGWKLRAGGGGSGNDISLIRFDADGVEQDEPVVIDWATGNVTLSADLDLGDDIVVDSITATTVVSDAVDGFDLSEVFAGNDQITSLDLSGTLTADSGATIGDGSGGLTVNLLKNNGAQLFLNFYKGTGESSASKRFRYDTSEDFRLEHYNGSSWEGIRPFTASNGFRSVSSDGALEIVDTDKNIILEGSTTGTKAATLTSAHPGQELRVRLAAASGGEYTIGSTLDGAAGDVTLNAAAEAVDLVYDGTVWQVMHLDGATHA